MKTENFDDAIRKKLESIPQTYTDKDVEKVFSYVTRKKAPFFRRVTGNVLSTAAVAAAAGGLLLWSIFHDADPAVSTTELLSTASISPNTELSMPSSAGVTDFKSLPSGTESLNSPTKKIKERAAGYPVSEPVASTGTKPDQYTQPAIPGQETASANEIVPVGESTAKEENTNPNTEALQKPKIQQAQAVEKERRGAISGTQTEDKNTAQPKPAEKRKLFQKVTDNTRNAANKQKRMSEEWKEPEQGQNNVTAHAEDSVRKVDEKRFQIHLGLGSSVSTHEYGGGAFAEMIFLQKWLLSAGVVYHSYLPEHFKDEADFHNRKSTHFKDRYPAHANELDHIKDIRLINRFFAIPLNFAYRIQLKNHFSTFVSIGTELNIVASQKIQFDGNKPIDSISQRADFTIRQKARLIDHFFLSTGVQKEWNRFLVTFEPFIRMQATDQRRKNNNFDPGLYLKVYYKIK